MLESLARLGYASKALIYVIVGGLAAAAAANRGGRITDTSGALRVILRQPFGRALLIVLAIGLCGYALWRFLDAFVDPDRHGTDFKGLTVRIGNVLRGSIYGALGVEAFRLARGLGASGGGEAQLWTARIMDLPLGSWLVGIAGVIIATFGISQIVGAVRLHIDRLIDLSAVPAALRGFAVRVSRFGVGARGVIIVVLGTFLVRAAMTHDPSEVHGTRQSVLEIANAVQGRWLLAAMAAGLIAYGIDQALHARCRRISPVV
jgi:hypothetical protein